MDVTIQIIEAFRALILAKDNAAEAARYLGVNQSMLSRCLSGKATWITPKVWRRIEPLLRPYLPSDLVTKQISLPNPAPNPVMGIPMTERQAERTEGNARPSDKLEAGLLEEFRKLPLDAQVAVYQCVKTGVPPCAIPNSDSVAMRRHCPRQSPSGSDKPMEKAG